MQTWFTPHMKDVWEKESTHDFLVYAYVDRMIDRFDIDDEQTIDRIFDVLNSTDFFTLKVDEEQMIDIMDRIY